MKKTKTSKGKKLYVSKESITATKDETVENVSEPLTDEPADNQEPKEVKSDSIQEQIENKTTFDEDSRRETLAEENTVLVKRTLRCGQSIQFDGNVVVLGDVNPGSEIVATGNIIVMGVLRGVVHAGAAGNEKATVAAFRLRPTQLRIANHITRAPDGDYLAPECPEIARIKEGVVVIETYQMGQQSKIS